MLYLYATSRLWLLQSLICHQASALVLALGNMVWLHVVWLFETIVFEPRGGRFMMSCFWSALFLGWCTGVGARWSEKSGSSLTESASPHGNGITSSSSITFLIFLPYMSVSGWDGLRVEAVWWPSSVPDLSEYRVWLGVSDIWKDSPDSFNRQEISIAHVICGPEGSSLALIRLSKWVSVNH